MAALPADAGWNMLVVERSTVPRDAGHRIDFFGPEFDTAEPMGLLPALRDIAYPVNEVSHVNQHGRQRSASLACRNSWYFSGSGELKDA